MSKLNVLLLRLGLGLVSGWFLNLLFFSKLPMAAAFRSGLDWLISLILAGIVVGAAYMSEALRKRGQ